MRLKTVCALAYRELYQIKGRIKGIAVGLLGMSLLSVMVLLSFYYGNIGLYLGDVLEMPEAAKAGLTPEELAAVPTAEQVMYTIKYILAAGVKAYPILMCGFLVTEAGTNAAKDERKTWQYFFRSVPATPLEKSAATYSLVILFDLIGIAIALIFSGIVVLMTGIPICKGDISVMIAALAIGNVFCVLMHLGIKFFHSADKAGIVIFGTAFVLIFGGNLINAFSDVSASSQTAHQTQQEAVNMFEPGKMEEFYNGLADKILPIAIPAAILAPVIGFAVYYLICKRREK